MSTAALPWSRRLVHGLAAPLRLYQMARTCRRSQRSDAWGPEQLRAHHDARLREIVMHAGRRIPFYRRLYSEAGVDLDAFRGVEDLHRLPTIGKTDLVERGHEMTLPGVPSWMTVPVRTSGSSGSVATVWTYRGLINRELGYIEALWQRVGASHREPMAALRGLRPSDPDRCWEYHRVSRRLVLSAYHLTAETAREYLDLMKRYRVRWLHAYPSAAWLLVTAAKSAGIRCEAGLRGVLLASETLFTEQVPAVAEFFGCRVFAHYGHREMALLAGWCEGSNEYHFLPRYGYVEFLAAGGECATASATGGVSELVGTGYLNRYMPLIRYRTNDFAAPSEPGACPACGRWHVRARTIYGRGQELLVGRAGNVVPVTAIASFAYERVKRFQFRQDAAGEVGYWFVPARAEQGAEIASRLAREFERQASFGLNVRVHPVDELPPAPGGKARLVVRSIPLPWERPGAPAGPADDAPTSRCSEGW